MARLGKSSQLLEEINASLLTLGRHYNRNFQISSKNYQAFFLFTKWNMIQYANIGNFWLKNYIPEVWLNFDLLIIYLFCWIVRQKCVKGFWQILVILIVVARATRRAEQCYFTKKFETSVIFQKKIAFQ